ncbi:AMP-dependent synthetase/ligase [Gleimia hominis]|uniref:Acyl-CoA synthetase n=1 Tax=Gleimia hominis TaxID=595468 RepID=A0ABU3IAR8_9ACTO|nr:AMP-dependent synthetase/ligase [Gleimia hominis]MDT3767460.1 AMP-dependent synthetase/ligase [Gleimia hominis]
MTAETEANLSGGTGDQQDVVEWHGPILRTVEPEQTIAHLIRERVRANPQATVVAQKSQMGSTWRNVSGGEFIDEVDTVARGLLAMGLKRGDAIAIMSHTRYEWTLLDVAGWSLGLVVVPIYETSSVDQIAHILEDSRAKVVFTETMVMYQLVQAARSSGVEGLKIFSFDNSAMLRVTADAADVPQERVMQCLSELTIDDTATIIYTSGTTGKPKGVELKHSNFTSLCLNGHEWMPQIAKHSKSRLLLFLPLAHVYARFLEVFQLTGEGVLGHTPDTKNLLSDLESFRPSYLLAVPRVLEKIYNSAQQTAGTGLKHTTFSWAAKTAIEYSRALSTEEGPSRVLKTQHQLADALVYRKLRDLLGGNVDYVISGGGPLGERLGHFYRGMGVTVLEGYGLTETTAPLAVNTPDLSKIGTVGKPIATVNVRIAQNREILVKGPSVFSGYHNLPERTAESIDEDGWFHTGDFGSLDRDGYLRITGRLKELIVTAGGKNVAPNILEDRLRGHPLISQVVVVGDKRPFIGALVTLDAEMLPGWLKNHGLPPLTLSQAVNEPEVQSALNRAVERANQAVSRAESIRKIKILTTDFTQANGLLTPSLKVKRELVLRQFEDEINDLYGGPVTDAQN